MIEILAEIQGEDRHGKFTCGIVLRSFDGTRAGERVIEAAPKVKWMKGMSRDQVRAHCQANDWKVTVVTRTES